MPALSELVSLAAFLAPAVAYEYLLYRLSAHRRDGRRHRWWHIAASFRVLRPELYTEAGQPLLRVARAVAALTIPYLIVVAWVLG